MLNLSINRRANSKTSTIGHHHIAIHIFTPLSSQEQYGGRDILLISHFAQWNFFDRDGHWDVVSVILIQLSLSD